MLRPGAELSLGEFSLSEFSYTGDAVFVRETDISSLAGASLDLVTNHLAQAVALGQGGASVSFGFQAHTLADMIAEAHSLLLVHGDSIRNASFGAWPRARASFSSGQVKQSSLRSRVRDVFVYFVPIMDPIMDIWGRSSALFRGMSDATGDMVSSPRVVVDFVSQPFRHGELFFTGRAETGFVGSPIACATIKDQSIATAIYRAHMARFGGLDIVGGAEIDWRGLIVLPSEIGAVSVSLADLIAGAYAWSDIKSQGESMVDLLAQAVVFSGAVLEAGGDSVAMLEAQSWFLSVLRAQGRTVLGLEMGSPVYEYLPPSMFNVVRPLELRDLIRPWEDREIVRPQESRY